MSTWTSKAALLGLSLIVAGCGGRFDGVSRAAPTAAKSSGQSQIAVAGSTVMVSGPAGFCVDPSATRANAAQPFVLMGNCAAISGNESATQPGVKAVLTASVIPSANPNIPAPQMAAFLTSDDGRRALSRADRAETVTVLDTFEKDGAHFVYTRDTSDGPVQDLAADYWRAYFGVNDQLVSASVLGFRDAAVTKEKGLEILQDFTRRIRADSPAPGQVAAPVAAPVAAAPAVAPAPTPVAEKPKTPWTGGTLGGVGLFRRILG